MGLRYDKGVVIDASTIHGARHATLQTCVQPSLLSLPSITLILENACIERSHKTTRDPIQYKDALPVYESLLWR